MTRVLVILASGATLGAILCAALSPVGVTVGVPTPAEFRALDLSPLPPRPVAGNAEKVPYRVPLGATLGLALGWAAGVALAARLTRRRSQWLGRGVTLARVVVIATAGAALAWSALVGAALTWAAFTSAAGRMRLAAALSQSDALDPRWRSADLMADARTTEFLRELRALRKLHGDRFRDEDGQDYNRHRDERSVTRIHMHLAECGQLLDFTRRCDALDPVTRFALSHRLSADDRDVIQTVWDALTLVGELDLHSGRTDATLWRARLALALGELRGRPGYVLGGWGSPPTVRSPEPETVYRLLGLATPPDAELAALAEFYAELPRRDPLGADRLRGLRAWADANFACRERVGRGPLFFFDAGDEWIVARARTVVDWLRVTIKDSAEHAQFLLQCNRLLAGEIPDLQRGDEGDSGARPRWFLLSHLESEQMRRAGRPERHAVAALGAERFRLARGRWPWTIAELFPDFVPCGERPADYNTVSFTEENGRLTVSQTRPVANGWYEALILFPPAERGQPALKEVPLYAHSSALPSARRSRSWRACRCRCRTRRPPSRSAGPSASC